MDPWSAIIESPGLLAVSPPSPSDIPPPDGLRLDPASWWTFAAAEIDALLIGDEVAIWRVISSVWPTLPKPRFWCDSRNQRLDLASYREGILILQNIHDLKMRDQLALLEWCEEEQARSRTIATASRQLLDRVADGTFSRSLYDHLAPMQLVLIPESDEASA